MPPEDAGDGYTVTYDATDSDQPTVAIVEAVAWVTGVEPLDLVPLHYSVDADALNRPFAAPDWGDFYRSTTRMSVTSPSLEFEYEACRETVTATHVHVEGREGTSEVYGSGLVETLSQR